MKNLMFIFGIFFIGYALAYYSVIPSIRRYIGARFVASFVLLTLSSFYAPSAAVFFVAILIIFPLTVRDHTDAICRYVLLVALVPAVSWNISLGPMYIGAIDQIGTLGLALLVSLWLKPQPGARDSTRGFGVQDAAVLVLLLILWLGAGRFGSLSNLARNFVTQGFILVLPFWLMSRKIRSLGELEIIVAILAVATILLAVFAVYEMRTGWALFDYATRFGGSDMMSKNAGRRGGALRSSVTMATPLNLACFITLGMIALACTRRFFVSTKYYLVIWVVLAVGFLAPQSRGNLIGLVLAFVVLAMAWRKWGLVVLVAAGSAATSLILFSIAKFSPRISAFLNLDAGPTTGVASGVYDYRQLLLQRGMEEGMKHMWFGSSLGDAVNRLQDIQQGEHIVDLVNEYLTIFLISGLSGLIPVAVLLISSGWQAASGFPKKIDPQLSMMRAFCLASFCMILFQLGFMSFIDRMAFMLLFVLAAIRTVARNKTVKESARYSVPGSRVHSPGPILGRHHPARPQPIEQRQ